MNEKLKQRLIEYLYDAYQDSMFDKHSVRDHILYGSNFPGLNNMTDAELIEDYETMVGDEDELLTEIKADAAIVNMLTE
jgi:hypothetical protein